MAWPGGVQVERFLEGEEHFEGSVHATQHSLERQWQRQNRIPLLGSLMHENSVGPHTVVIFHFFLIFSLLTLFLFL